MSKFSGRKTSITRVFGSSELIVRVVKIQFPLGFQKL